MIDRRRAKSRPWRLALAFVGLHVFFAVRTALPALVICHKAGGGCCIEFDTAGGCACEECEHCRARQQAPRSGPAAPGFEACHCRHEIAFSDAGHASLRLPDRHPFLYPSAPPASDTIEMPAPRGFGLHAGEFSGRSPGPSGRAASLLRC
jgi:hypothetical protein